MARAERLTNQAEAEDWAFKDPPVLVYADNEAMQESDGEYFPIMVCCETDEEDYNHTFYGAEGEGQRWLWRLVVFHFYIRFVLLIDR